MKKILIVEDCPDIRELYHMYLSDYEIYAFDKADLALKNFFTIDPDIFVIDIGLPGVSGLQLVERLRNEHKVTKPMIIISGEVDFVACEKALSNGVSQVIQKPFDQDELIEAIERYVR